MEGQRRPRLKQLLGDARDRFSPWSTKDPCDERAGVSVETGCFGG